MTSDDNHDCADNHPGTLRSHFGREATMVEASCCAGVSTGPVSSLLMGEQHAAWFAAVRRGSPRAAIGLVVEEHAAWAIPMLSHGWTLGVVMARPGHQSANLERGHPPVWPRELRVGGCGFSSSCDSSYAGRGRECPVPGNLLPREKTVAGGASAMNTPRSSTCGCHSPSTAGASASCEGEDRGVGGEA